MVGNTTERTLDSGSLLGVADRLDREFLEQNYELSRKVLSRVIEEGGIVTDQRIFTFAMHGFWSGGIMRAAIPELAKQYESLSEDYRHTEGQPIGFMTTDTIYDKRVNQLRAIGIIRSQPDLDLYSGDTTPLIYRIRQVSREEYRGYVEVPVVDLHEWTRRSSWSEEENLTVMTEDRLVVARVEHSASPSRLDFNRTKAFDRKDNIRIGAQAIISAHEFDYDGRRRHDSRFLGRFMTAWQHFDGKFPFDPPVD